MGPTESYGFLLMKKFGRFYVNMGDFRHIWRKITKKMEFLLLRCVIGATHRCEIFKIWSCGMSLVPHTPCEIFKVSDVVWHGSHIKVCHNHSHWSVVWVSFRYLLCHTILYPLPASTFKLFNGDQTFTQSDSLFYL